MVVLWGRRFLLSEAPLLTVNLCRCFIDPEYTGKSVSLQEAGPFYRGTLFIRNRLPPEDHHRTLGLGLL